jgi:hypothetical protein
MKNVTLRKSTRGDKKWMVTVTSGGSRGSRETKRTVHFGSAGMSDYTKHKDPERKASYIARHAKRENWTASGITTAGFWSRWLLWNEPSILASKRSISRRFGVKFN